MYLLRRAIVLAAMWCLLSGRFDALHLGAGLLAAAAIAWAGQGRRYPRPLPVLRLLAYLPWLLVAVLKSNLHVARLVLARRLAIAPRFASVRHGMADARGQALLGGSITLTPGTVAVDLGADTVLVHALDAGSLADLEKGAMLGRVRAIFPTPTAEVAP